MRRDDRVGMFDERAWWIRLALDDVEPDAGESPDVRPSRTASLSTSGPRLTLTIIEPFRILPTKLRSTMWCVDASSGVCKMTTSLFTINSSSPTIFAGPGSLYAHHIVREYRCAEPVELARGCAADAAIADHPDRQFVRPPQSLGGEQSPAPRAHLAVVLVDAAREREHQCDCMVGDFFDAVVRNVRYEYASLGRCRECDVVRPDADARDMPQFRRLCDHLGRNLRVGHHDRFGVVPFDEICKCCRIAGFLRTLDQRMPRTPDNRTLDRRSGHE